MEDNKIQWIENWKDCDSHCGCDLNCNRACMYRGSEMCERYVDYHNIRYTTWEENDVSRKWGRLLSSQGLPCNPGYMLSQALTFLGLGCSACDYVAARCCAIDFTQDNSNIALSET